MCVCVSAGECMCQARGRGGTSICQRSVSALGMNLISVIRFKSTTKTSSLSKVGFGSMDWANLSKNLEQSLESTVKQSQTFGDACCFCSHFILTRLQLADLLTSTFFSSTSVHWGHHRLVFLFICPVDYSGYSVHFNTTWANRTPLKKKTTCVPATFSTHRQKL